MARRTSLRNQLYRDARDVGKAQPVERGHCAVAKQEVRRKFNGLAEPAYGALPGAVSWVQIQTEPPRPVSGRVRGHGRCQ
jgi:hypothetical protein